MKFALAIISIHIVNVGRPSISHNDWRVLEVLRVGGMYGLSNSTAGEEFGRRP